MLGELLIIIVGFFKWLFKGCKTDLQEEINGQKDNLKNIRGLNYLIGLIVFLFLILILIIFM